MVRTVSQTVSHWLPWYPNSLLLQQLELEARIGIEHQSLFFSNSQNSRQHNPLRSFLNDFNPLIRLFPLQQLFWNTGSTIYDATPNYCGTIILLELLLEVVS